jgi:hypothetical protein
MNGTVPGLRLLRSAARIDPGTGSRLAPVLDLFTRTVTAVELEGRGTLRMRFDDGAEMIVPPDPQFESWQLSGHNVGGVLVGPGGDTDWEPLSVMDVPVGR